MICKHCGSPIRWVEGHGWAKPKDSFAEMGYCSKREKGHQLRDERDFALAAERIWKGLRTLDPNRAERSELAAAGVPKHTIDALLDESFEVLAPGLSALFTLGSLDHFAKHKRFPDAGAYSMRDALGANLHQLYRDEWEKWGGCEEEWAFVKHINSILPLGLKANVARQCSTYLWYACWYMSHADQLPASEKRTQWLVEFIEYLLPDLFKRVNAYHRAQQAKSLVGA